jgi:molybdenum cofactor cytidylyltransferase
MEKSIYAIVLAAGLSRRFGSNKLLYEVDGKKMYWKIVEELLKVKEQFQDFTVVVVTRYEEILHALENENVHTVYHKHSEQGIASSLQKGLTYAYQLHQKKNKDFQNAAYLFCVADQPYLSNELITGFLTSFLESPKRIGCVAKDERLGNPCIFEDTYRDELMELSGEEGGKIVLKHHIEDVYIYQVTDNRMLVDIDYPLK